MVRKNLKYGYYLITMLFCVLTIIEIFVYIRMYSNLLGVIYLFINFFIFFLLFTVSINFEKANKNIRFSKIILVIVLGLVAGFVVSLLLPFMISYTDSSFVFENKIFITSKILKPIIFLILGYFGFLELDIKYKLFKLIKFASK